MDQTLSRDDGFEKISVIHQAQSETQADIWLVRPTRGDTVVLRDYSGRKNWIVRRLCRWALKREVRVHRLLQGMVGIPHLIQVLDRDRYLIEWVEGNPLSSYKKVEMPAPFFQDLESILSEMHSRKVAHGDLRNKNIMVTPDGKPVVIDFSTAWWGTSPWRIPFFKFLRTLDLRRLAKSKEKFCPSMLTEAEIELLAHTPWYHRFGRLYRHGLYPKWKERRGGKGES